MDERGTQNLEKYSQLGMKHRKAFFSSKHI